MTGLPVRPGAAVAGHWCESEPRKIIKIDLASVLACLTVFYVTLDKWANLLGPKSNLKLGWGGMTLRRAGNLLWAFNTLGWGH